MNARRIQIVGALFLTVLSVPSLCGQSSVGDSMQILSLFGRFFEARPGHWGGWELETYPQVTQIEFVNAERTKANANVTIGYSGATVVLEKVDGKWRAVRLTNRWIT